MVKMYIQLLGPSMPHVCVVGVFLFLSSPGTILSETDTEAEQLSQEDYPDVPDNEKFHLMADIYSYGQLMAYILTGRMPWQGLDSLSVTEGMIQKGDRVEIPEQLSGQLRNIIPVSYTHLTLPTKLEV